MNSKLEEYIESVNKFIILKEKHSFRDKMVSALKVNSKKLFISIEKPRDEEDREIVKNILDISEDIVLVTNDLEKFSFLKHKDRVFLYNASDVRLALSTDIYIFLYDRNLLNVLLEHKKAYNTAHPKNYPTKNPSLEEFGGYDKLKFYFGSDAKKINTFEDLVYYYWKGYIDSKDDRNLIINTFSISLKCQKV
jgi:hypothetical protein